jgi:hypothetical protein
LKKKSYRGLKKKRGGRGEKKRERKRENTTGLERCGEVMKAVLGFG